MSAKKIISDRKRSRPVEKRSKLSNYKKYKKPFGIFLIIIIVVAAISLALVYLRDNTNEIDKNNINGNDENNTSGNPIAVLDTTMGTIKIELYEDKLPITAGNFIKLVNDGFYDGMTFYRISDDFMIQAGRYFPDGSEDFSPYGTIEFETNEDVKHVDGAISMASTAPGVGGSGEFFICDGAQPFLDGNYAPFGVVIEGIEVVRNIAAQPHDNSNPAGGGVPLEDIIINSIIIEI
jgi:cyclophilin family peptidyl-prolyl cis-trans isomerase